jgi:Hydantoinase/oxoprolinase N-terminal region
VDSHNPEYIVGVDIGGTFTDCVVLSESGKITIGKALSTPDDFAQGALNAVADAARNPACPATMKFFVPPDSSSTPAPSARTRSSPAPGRDRLDYHKGFR